MAGGDLLMGDVPVQGHGDCTSRTASVMPIAVRPVNGLTCPVGGPVRSTPKAPASGTAACYGERPHAHDETQIGSGIGSGIGLLATGLRGAPCRGAPTRGGHESVVGRLMVTWAPAPLPGLPAISVPRWASMRARATVSPIPEPARFPRAGSAR